MKTKYFFCMGIALLLFSSCVESQNFVALENRVAAMEMEKNRQLSRQNEKTDGVTLRKDLEAVEKKLNDTISRDEYADLKYSVQTIKQDLQQVNGLIEAMNHNFENYTQKDNQAIEQKLERLDNAISKNYEKVIKLEKYMGFEPSAAVEVENKAAGSEEPKTANLEQEAYDFAKKLFDDGDNENARIQFENFINKYPDSKNSDNARFWIADSYYAEKWYEKAILEYQKVLEEYPKSNKLAAARLKQGYAFAELGEKANARLILKELIKKHPDSNEAKYAQEKLKSLN